MFTIRKVVRIGERQHSLSRSSALAREKKRKCKNAIFPKISRKSLRGTKFFHFWLKFFSLPMRISRLFGETAADNPISMEKVRKLLTRIIANFKNSLNHEWKFISRKKLFLGRTMIRFETPKRRDWVFSSDLSLSRLNFPRVKISILEFSLRCEKS